MPITKKRTASSLWGIAAVVLFIGSIALLLYPTVSKELNQQKANETINKYNAVAEITRKENITEDEKGEPFETESNNESDISRIADYNVFVANNSDYSFTLSDLYALWRDSEVYNNSLKGHQDFDDIDFSSSALDLSDYGINNGVYGYISIPDINLQMPILLGSSNYNMSVGVTHLYSTSLPLGGENTNCVISGHTGYTGKTFFDDIKKLPIGSIVTVTTFWGDLKYMVSEIKKIEISQTHEIYIQKGKDLLTLLTCADGGEKRWQVSCDRIYE